MNDPEVTMLQAPSNQLIALTTALEAAGEALTLARRVPAPLLTSLPDQVVRSASSVAAGLSEGHGRSGRDRLHQASFETAFRTTPGQATWVTHSFERGLSRRSAKHEAGHWRIADASAKDVDTHPRLLAGAGAVDAGRARSAPDLFDQVRAMTCRLLHPRG